MNRCYWYLFILCVVFSTSFITAQASKNDKHLRLNSTAKANMNSSSVTKSSKILSSPTKMASSSTHFQTAHEISAAPIVFPYDEVHPVVKRPEMPKQIPLSLLQELSEANDLSDFLQYVDNVTVIRSVEGRDPLVHGTWESPVDARIAGTSRGAVTKAKAANCMPELQTVQLVSNSEATVLFYPSCTRIERCGGCCTSDLYSCQPLTEETILVEVIKTQYTGGSRMKYAGKEIVPVEKHTSCKCQCRVKESDCSVSQKYDERACRCQCINEDDRIKCESENQTRYWDNNRCLCRCRADVRCSTGFYFDEDSCQCEQWIARRSDSGIRAVWGEDGRLTGNQFSASDHRLWSNEFKEDEESEDKSSRPVQRFHFSKLKKPIS